MTTATDLCKVTREQLEHFAAAVEANEVAGLHRSNLACEANLNNATVSIRPGRVYTKVDVGSSGRFMVENATGEVFGIKGYGVIHRGYYFGHIVQATAKIELGTASMTSRV